MKEISTFTDLKGETLSACVNKDDEEIVFTLEDGRAYRLYHEQDCCEHVSVEDVWGRLEDLVGSPLLLAEEAEEPEGEDHRPSYADSYSWVFYKLATVKGYVTIRWLGESNGYYSESVDFGQMT